MGHCLRGRIHLSNMTGYDIRIDIPVTRSHNTVA